MKKTKIIMSILFNLIFLIFFTSIWGILIVSFIVVSYKEFGFFGAFIAGMFIAISANTITKDFILKWIANKDIDSIEKFKCLFYLLVFLIHAIFWGCIIILPFGFFSSDPLEPYLMNFVYLFSFNIYILIAFFPYFKKQQKIWELEKEINYYSRYNCDFMSYIY